MAVKIGSARSSYGNTSRGDQNGGKEVSTQDYYRSSKGAWRVLRANDAAKREKIAYAMQAFCDDNRVGYSQSDRYALYAQLKDKGFDPKKITAKTNCDCSSLIRVCCAYAGITLPDFITSNEASVLLKSGEFTELTDMKYREKSDYLCRGDILVTPVKGHTVAVLSNGSKYSESSSIKAYALGDRELCNGSVGDDVKELQNCLIQIGYSCGSFGADGEYGDCTEMAVRLFQGFAKITADGICGSDTVAAIRRAMANIENDVGGNVHILGGKCYVRTGPGVGYDKLGILNEGNIVAYAGETSPDGWLKVAAFDGGWVSGKYGRRVEY